MLAGTAEEEKLARVLATSTRSHETPPKVAKLMTRINNGVKTLIARLMDGEDAAFTELIEDYGPFVRRHIRFRLRQFGRIRSIKGTSDFFQDTFSKIYNYRKNLTRIKSDRHLRSYLLRMAAQIVSNEMTKRFKTKQYDLSLESHGDHDPVIDNDPAVIALHREEIEHLLNTDPIEHAKVYYYKMQGHGILEIAKKSGLSSSTVGRLLQAARTHREDDTDGI